ncbi:hypothetical protein PAPYR_7525 [Paratrimastix pyriformis]|uniref:Uncharacterized protein n=1 Tax=Paratrimastix pyriformis TaxID=342808 RepID=A0ABQ8UCM0_9EUKA|nr:hypothetical protein PAPYR_7525 [Paratrimastix pyriformis]
MLFDIDATREPLRQTYSNALVFRNAFYFVRQDGKIEYRQSIPFDPVLQQEDCFRASQEKQRDVLEKAINEFDIQFHLGEIAMVAYDIETYSSTPGVPLPDDPLAHIGMICAALPANVAVHVDSSEAGMCCAFISWVRAKSAEREILVGWNSNQQPFSQQAKKKTDEPENKRPAGYDYPWIMKRCGAFAQTQMAAPYKGSGLAYVYSSLVNIVQVTPPITALDTILGALKLPLKQRHNMSYAVMNKIMMDPNAATENPEHCLENIIRYCVYDAEAVLHIADKMDSPGF